MGHFSNGTVGMLYQEQWCERCLNDLDLDCAVWLAHLIYNSEECNKVDSILHLLIPLKNGIENQQCKMFREMPHE
ncbi:hypothetical protein LCGC14_1621980 [marine sediment metagenome]|uniref:Uncharacterized protein n=1 Tax=marine sediment metagenome TaxID=412755 RepID=A0A0F9IS77_9ZZZZ